MNFDLSKAYQREEALSFLQDVFLPEDLELIEQEFELSQSSSRKIAKAFYLGHSPSLNLHIYEFHHHSSDDPRISITREIFRFISNRAQERVLAFVANPNKKNYRLSLITLKVKPEGKSHQKEFSSPRRYSYFLGPDAKINTPKNYLLSKGRVKDFADLQSRFSIEVVNREFFEKIAKAFMELAGGKQGASDFGDGMLKLPGSADHQKKKEFAVRLIGRIIFCWFLKKKSSASGCPLMPDHLMSSNNVCENYYHTKLEPIFFQILNKKQEERHIEFRDNEDLKTIPFLNGGLFQDHKPDDYYDSSSITGYSQGFNILEIPDKWFKDFFKVLEEYNFTIDENTSSDIDLSVDPEMLGRIFENLLAEINLDSGKTDRKRTGSFYTPREIVDYMVTQSLKSYFLGCKSLSEEVVSKILDDNTSIEEDELSFSNKNRIVQAISRLRVIDPACGSGAFPMGVLQKVVRILKDIDPDATLWINNQVNSIVNSTLKEATRAKYLEIASFKFKKDLISYMLYGVDIQPIAVEISKLRVFLSLIVDAQIDEKDDKGCKRKNRGVDPLPNLEFKFISANSLVQLPYDIVNLSSSDMLMQNLKDLRDFYYETSDASKKDLIKKEFYQTRDKLFDEAHRWSKKSVDDQKAKMLSLWDPFSLNTSEWFCPEWMFGVPDGFDIVIGNPPYVSTKGRDESDKQALKKEYGFVDDLYSHFFFRSLEFLKKETGVLCFITSKTFWTIQTKRNLRELFLKHRIIELCDTSSPFEAMVDTGISIIQRNDPVLTNEIEVKDGKSDINNPHTYSTSIETFQNSPNNVFFIPNEFNMGIFQKYSLRVKQLMEAWWEKISTSKNIEKNKVQLEAYRKSLKPGEITLLGLITEGGQGLATANNGKYVGAIEGSKTAENILDSRSKKLMEAIIQYKIKELSHFQTKADSEDFLSRMSELEIRELFDSLKEKYGRDIFGQGYLFRIVPRKEIADVSTLSPDEKANGINGSNTFVPYDKGDKEGNRWYLDTPYYIDWSRENVNILQTDPKARWQGYQFFFREGFCWSDIHTVLIKSRLKTNGIHDVKSMSMFSLSDLTTDKYLVSILNSRFISEYDFNFVNNTQTFQINDARQIPIIIPSQNQLRQFESIFDQAYSIQKDKFDEKIIKQKAETHLEAIQSKLDEMVYGLYQLTPEEIALVEKDE